MSLFEKQPKQPKTVIMDWKIRTPNFQFMDMIV